ncbi:MAG: M14 family metallopeptidase, partial [Acidobacteriota bacterium]
MLPALMIAALLLSVPGSPRTLAERTEFARTSRYDETLEFCRRLDRQSSAIHTTVFGTSPEGRDLILVVASAERAFTAEAARRTGKPIVLIQAGIHAGEIAGKDAGLMLLRDIAASDGEAALLDHAIILFMPIYNVDGHERFGRYNRINQNGPERMGWRVTARNLNLNRDYMKADAAETRAWLGVFTSWWPDLTIDCHTTDGGDYQYDVTYLYESGPNAPPPVGRWIEKAVNERVVPDLVATGHLPSRYISFADSNDPAAGVRDFGITRPMFSNGYTVLQNRPSLTIEAHAI